MELMLDKSLRAMWHGGRRPISAVEAIVFHYTANTGTSATAKGNARYFANGAEGRKASAHYVVDEGEIVYECVPLDTVAWAVGDGSTGKYGKSVNNYNSVSIEMVSHTHPDGTYYISDETQHHAAQLYHWLKRQLPNLKYTVRHYDISGKLCPMPMVQEHKWQEFLKLVKGELEMTKEELMSTRDTGDKPSNYAREATNWAKKNKVFNGDATGSYGWQQPIKREDVAQVLYNFAKSIGKA